MRVSEDWRPFVDDLAELAVSVVQGFALIALAGFALAAASDAWAWLHTVAACPIHVTTTTGADYCMHLGLGR